MEENEYSLDDIIKNDVTEEIQRQIYKCMKVYGIEGLEDKIKEIYEKMPKLKDLFLTEYYKIIRK